MVPLPPSTPSPVSLSVTPPAADRLAVPCPRRQLIHCRFSYFPRHCFSLYSSVQLRFVAHDGSLTAIDSSVSQCNSTTIISCSLYCTVKFWGLLDGTKLRTVAFPCPVMGIALDQMRAEFFFAGSDEFIYKGLINVGSKIHVNQEHECTRWAQKHESGIVSLVIATDNLVSASEDRMVYISEIDTGEAIMGLGSHIGSISEMVVANLTGQGLKVGKKVDNFGEGINRVELSRPLKDSLELEDVLRVAEKGPESSH
ncbi:putative Non-LTR retroelement reverse transcriptase [Hibiscus syriacus]|uniref:Non-LTR retroelement reverse transcriptase n=1 Tax=Hibiscus syriacus TaxID=106335 RepID=A0A6A3ADZ3_HIBSY|nr:putative Non-LTR retroelement reverse transcriptase [Hibiscus syriacus]